MLGNGGFSRRQNGLANVHFVAVPQGKAIAQKFLKIEKVKTDQLINGRLVLQEKLCNMCGNTSQLKAVNSYKEMNHYRE